MKKNKPYVDIVILTLCELAVSVLTVIGFIVCDAMFDIAFSYRVITGVILGTLVTVLNYVFLTLSVNRAINNFLALRGDREMDDEEAAAFARENSAPIQNAMKLSFIIRTFTMLIALVIGFLLDVFNPIATAIPLLAYRPLLSITEIIKGKIAK